MSIKKDILWRIGLVYITVFLFALVITSKVMYLQFIKGEEWKQKSEEERVKNFKIPAHRGDIYACDLRLLSSSVPYYEVRMDMKADGVTDKVFYKNIDSLSYCLATLFWDKSKDEYKRALINARKRGDRYYAVKTDVNYLQLKKLKKFPIFRLGRYKGGVVFAERSKRVNPHENLATRTIGYLSQGQSGNIVGIEGAYDSYLAGTEGLLRKQKLSGSDWMPIDDDANVDPKDGSSVVTTIDVDLQDVAHRALLKQLQLHQAQYGTVVLMEVASGDVKAIVNLKEYSGTYREVYNYAIGASLEPGSTFKVPAIMAALEDGYVDLDDTVDTKNGTFKYYDITITDESAEHGGYGRISVQQVIEKSSNVGMAKIITEAYKGNPRQFVDHLINMGLNKELGLGIKGEGKPMLNYPGEKYWSGVSLGQMSYGYEVKMTPLQILTFYNAIANEGKMVKPRFVKEIRFHGKTELTFPTQVIKSSICSRSTLGKVNKMLEGVVTEGTAVNLKASNFKIAGKTGTTQIFNEKYGYKGKMSYQASFVGYFPAENPKYSCIVVINSPSKDVYYGNQVAGPVFLEIANKVYSTSLSLQEAINDKGSKMVEIPFSKNGYSKETITALEKLNIKTVVDKNLGDWVYTQKEDNCIKLGTKRNIENLMPDVVSMGLKDALYLLENKGLIVEVVGRGSIKKQSIIPGTRINKGQKVVLELSFTEG